MAIALMAVSQFFLLITFTRLHILELCHNCYVLTTACTPVYRYLVTSNDIGTPLPCLPAHPKPDRYLYTVHMYSICHLTGTIFAKLIFTRVVNLSNSGLVNLSENRNGEFWWRGKDFTNDKTLSPISNYLFLLDHPIGMS